MRGNPILSGATATAQRGILIARSELGRFGRWVRTPSSAVFWTHLFLFFGLLFVFTRDNRFPFYYHPDEVGKVEQLHESKLNFHHPLMMLNATGLALGMPLPGTLDRQEYKRAVKKGKFDASSQEIISAGRTVNATFAAAALVMLSTLAWGILGWRGSLATALMVLVGTDLHIYARYFKEDPSLVFGLAMTFQALWHAQEKFTPKRVAWLGVCCALAASGKYIGIVALAFVLPVLWIWIHRPMPPSSAPIPRRRYWLAFFGGLLLTLLAINPQFLIEFATFREGLGSEMEKLESSTDGLTRQIPHGVQWQTMWTSTPFLVLALAAACPLIVAFWRKRWDPALLAAWAFPWVYCGILSFSSKAGGRYFLPADLFLHFLAAVALGALALIAQRSTHPLIRVPGPWAVLVLGAGICGAQWGDFNLARKGFTEDSRLELIHYIRDHLPADAVIAQDKKVKLPNDLRPDENVYPVKLSQKVIVGKGTGFVCDLGDLDTMRGAQGITHIAVCNADYGRFFSTSKLRDGQEIPLEVVRRREFYARLFSEGELLWSTPTGVNGNLAPGLRLYRVKGTGLNTAKPLSTPFSEGLPVGHPGRNAPQG